MKSTNASVFIPHLGCPHECSFCNKNAITENIKSVEVCEVTTILENHVKSLARRKFTAEIAFFGGTFTALSYEYREKLLTIANDFLSEYPEIFTGIRISTRPDCIDVLVLEQLCKYNITAIELGCQSMDDDVLIANERGHNSNDVRKSAKLIKDYGVELGVQMMTGLYRDTPEKCLYTCNELIKLQPNTARIYPTVVVAGTKLAQIGHSPFPLEQTIDLCADIYGRFVENGVRVIRLGLNSKANPHNAIGELCISRYYYKRILAFMQKSNFESGATKFRIFTDKRNISKIVGQKGENKCKLLEHGFTYKIKEKPSEDLEIDAI
ncbi:MAG: radical SAM protein [Oscillospiraceae bacterium]|nr:radical SAM protein [Oscillospiraceae bacterium]